MRLVVKIGALIALASACGEASEPFASAGPDHDHILGYVAREGDVAGMLARRGVDTTDTEALIDMVREGPGFRSRKASLYLAAQSAPVPGPLLHSMYRAALMTEGREAKFAYDYLFVSYALGNPGVLRAASEAADSLADAGRMGYLEYNEALRVLLALGDTSQIDNAVAEAGSGCCLRVLARIVQADTSLYPRAERALLGAMESGRVTPLQALQAIDAAIDPDELPGGRGPSPAFETSLTRVLDAPGLAHESRRQALLLLRSRRGPHGDYGGRGLVEAHEHLLNDPDATSEDQRAVFELALENDWEDWGKLREFVAAAAGGEHGPGLVRPALAALAARRR